MSNMIYKKMSEIMKEIGAIQKSSINTAQGFKFRGIDQFVNALHPALTKHGVFMTPECVSSEQQLKDVVRGNGKAGVDKHVTLMMRYHFFAEDGSTVVVGPIPSEGLDSGDKATNKALSAALKYALIQTFSVPTEDMTDGDSDSPVIGTRGSVAPAPSQAAPRPADASTTPSLLGLSPTESPVAPTPSPAAKRPSPFRKSAPVATDSGGFD